MRFHRARQEQVKARVTKFLISKRSFGRIYFMLGGFLLALAGGVMALSVGVSAYESTSTTATKNASVTVSAACSFSAGGGEYSRTVYGGSNTEITANNITTSCNDLNGYAIYAIGYSGDSYDSNTHTDLITSLGDSYNIKTAGNTYGSNWQMKITPVTNAVTTNNFNTYQNIPDTFTKVAQYTANTNNGTITPSYQVSIANSQPAGTYTGKVKYVLVHPNGAAAPSTAPGECTDTATCMQTATSVNCGTTLTDSRDGNTYTTAAIKGLCWMTQNLALGSSTTITLTPDDTNISSNYTLPARGTYGTSTSGEYVWGNDTQCTSSSTTACAGYYSYTTATAGINGSGDICPKGWRLPSHLELTALKDTYTTGKTLTKSPFLGVYAGYYNGSSFRDGGSYGYYWSSSENTSVNAWFLNFNSSSAYVSYYGDKFLGYSIRCVAKS